MYNRIEEIFNDAELRKSIAALSALRSISSDVKLQEVLDTAIDSMKCLRAKVYIDDDFRVKQGRGTDCLVVDHGRGGYYYECTGCGEGWWNDKLDFGRRGHWCGRVIDTVKLEMLDPEFVSSAERLTLVKDLLSSMDNEELRRLTNEYNSNLS